MVNTFKERFEALKKEVVDAIQNPELSLDERWEILIENSDLGKTSWRTDFGLGDDEFLYEGPLYMSKFETMNVKDILEALKEDDDDDGFFTPEDEITFKQYCVDGCYSKMKFDW